MDVSGLTAQPLVLASASPRRQELLALLRIPFEVIPSTADETVSGNGRERVKVLAQRKGEEVAARLNDRVVLSADTLVCVDDQILGKPESEADACRMLTLLSGREHQVYTGVCLIVPGRAPQVVCCATAVHFAPLSPQLIARYVATGEPMDKAGAYAIQGHAGAFIDRIDGSPTNVIGLPLEAVAKLLSDAGYAIL